LHSHVRFTSSATWTSFACVALLGSSACTPAIPIQSRATTEGTVSADAFGNVHIKVGGRQYLLKPIDGRPVGNVSIQIAGKIYNTVGGNFQLPESAMRDFQSSSAGFFRVFATGYVPKQVSIGQASDDVPLVPMLAVKLVPDFPYAGGLIAASEIGVKVTIPAGVLIKPTTAIQVSTYVPVIAAEPGALSASLAHRQAFLDKFAAIKAAPHYAVATARGLATSSDATLNGAPATCTDAEQPLPCPPAAAGMGLMLTVNGPLRAGVVTNQLDLDAAARDPLRAAAAARLLQTFRQIDARPDGPMMRELLASQFGVGLTGHMLTFSVQLGPSAVTDGFVRFEVQGLDFLGVNMEFTAVSAIGDTLPQGASTPGLNALTAAVTPGLAASSTATLLPAGQRMIGQDGMSLLGPDGASALGLDGTGIVTRKTGLISQDGGSLIAQDSSYIIAQGGGNIIAQGGGNIVAQGGGNIIAQGGGNIIAQGGGNIIAQGGGNIIAQGGGNIIAQGGGNLITNDGGSLVGHVTAPFAPPELAKFALANYTDYPWPQQAEVRAVTFLGQPITPWVWTDRNSDYTFYKLPPTPGYFWLEVKAGPHILRSLAVAPGTGQVISNVNAATTAVASATFNALIINIADSIFLSPANVNADEVALRTLLDQVTAQKVVDSTIPQVSSIALRRFVTGAIVPRSFRIATLNAQSQQGQCPVGQNTLYVPNAPVVLSPLLGNVAVLANATVTNTGPTVLIGDLDLYPGTSITGFLPGTVMTPNTMHPTDAVAQQAQADLTSAYNDAASRSGATVLANNMGGQTLSPGIYRNASFLTISPAGLTLSGNGDPNAVFIFQIGSALTLNSGGRITLVNGAQASNVFWQVGSSATLGTYSAFAGSLLVNTSITLTTGATLEGRALARTGAVTLDSNTVITPPLSCP
jgi:hypothetical protein